MKLGNNLVKVISILILIIFLFSLTGCFDKREIDDLAYPLAVGLDIGEANALRLTLQLALPIKMGGGGEGGGGGGGGEGESTSIITIDTPSIYSGLNLINNLISKEINLSHAKVLIVSRKLAEMGFNDYLNAVVRGREFRPDIFIAISNNPPDKYLENVKPVLESNPSKYFELLLGKRFSSFYPTIRLDKFYNENKSDSAQPVAIFTQISEFKSTDQLKDAITGKNNGALRLEGEYTAGEIPVVSKQKVEVMGMAVFKKGKMIGTADGLEAACLQLINGVYKNSYWTIPDPYDKDKIVVLNVYQRKKPDIKTKVFDDRSEFTINIDLEGDFTSIQSNYNYEQNPGVIEEAFEKLLNDQLNKLLKRTVVEFNSDICGMGRYVKRHFLTWDDWEAYNWFGKYKNSVFNVNTSLKMRRTGLIIRSVDVK